MVTILQILAENIRRLRAERGWSQAELAENAHCSNNHVASVETLRKAPSFVLVEKLATALEVPSWRLFIDPVAPPSMGDIEGVIALLTQVKNGIETALEDWERRAGRAKEKVTPRKRPPATKA